MEGGLGGWSKVVTGHNPAWGVYNVSFSTTGWTVLVVNGALECGYRSQHHDPCPPPCRLWAHCYHRFMMVTALPPAAGVLWPSSSSLTKFTAEWATTSTTQPWKRLITHQTWPTTWHRSSQERDAGVCELLKEQPLLIDYVCALIMKTMTKSYSIQTKSTHGWWIIDNALQ